jgi:IS605 OrfB family transposase
LPDENRDTPRSEYLYSNEWETTGATLHYRSDSFHLHVRTDADVDDPEPAGNGTVLGMDLGAENIAVTSTGVVWSADDHSHWRTEYIKRRQSLRECGTRDVHKNVQSVRRTETGRFNQYLNRVANELVEETVESGCTVVASEDLTDIRDRMPDTMTFHEWAFCPLYGYVSYKAEERGLHIEQAHPRNTSRRCSSCGFTHVDSRDGETFHCESCGDENHADYTAAKNVGFRLLRNQTVGEGGAPVGVRLNTGILNANGVRPVRETVRVGVHGDSPRR